MPGENADNHADLISYGTDEDALRRRKEGYGLGKGSVSLKDRLAAFEKKAPSTSTETAGYQGGRGGKLNVSAFEKKKSDGGGDAGVSLTAPTRRRVGKLSNRIAAFQQGSASTEIKDLNQPQKKVYGYGGKSGGTVKLGNRFAAFEKKAPNNNNASSPAERSATAKTESLTISTGKVLCKEEWSTISFSSDSNDTSKQHEEDSIKKYATSADETKQGTSDNVNNQSIGNSKGEKKTAVESSSNKQPVEQVKTKQPDIKTGEGKQNDNPETAANGGTNEQSAATESAHPSKTTVEMKVVNQSSAEAIKEEETTKEETKLVVNVGTSVVEANNDQQLTAGHSVGETPPGIKSDEGAATAEQLNEQYSTYDAEPSEAAFEKVLNNNIASLSVETSATAKTECTTKPIDKVVCMDEKSTISTTPDSNDTSKQHKEDSINEATTSADETNEETSGKVCSQLIANSMGEKRTAVESSSNESHAYQDQPDIKLGDGKQNDKPATAARGWTNEQSATTETAHPSKKTVEMEVTDQSFAEVLKQKETTKEVTKLVVNVETPVGEANSDQQHAGHSVEEAPPEIEPDKGGAAAEGINEQSATDNAEPSETVADQVVEPSAESIKEVDTTKEDTKPVAKDKTSIIETNDTKTPPEIKLDEGESPAVGGTNEQSATTENARPSKKTVEMEVFDQPSAEAIKEEETKKEETKLAVNIEIPVVEANNDQQLAGHSVGETPPGIKPEEGEAAAKGLNEQSATDDAEPSKTVGDEIVELSTEAIKEVDITKEDTKEDTKPVAKDETSIIEANNTETQPEIKLNKAGSAEGEGTDEQSATESAQSSTKTVAKEPSAEAIKEEERTKEETELVAKDQNPVMGAKPFAFAGIPVAKEPSAAIKEEETTKEETKPVAEDQKPIMGAKSFAFTGVPVAKEPPADAIQEEETTKEETKPVAKDQKPVMGALFAFAGIPVAKEPPTEAIKEEETKKEETKPVAKDEQPVMGAMFAFAGISSYDKLDDVTNQEPEVSSSTEPQNGEVLPEAEKKRLKAEAAKRVELDKVAAREVEKAQLAEKARLEKERLAAEQVEQDHLARERRIAEKKKILRQKEEEEERLAALEEQRRIEQESKGSYAEFFTIKDDLTPPRELTEDEVETLKSILKIQVESHPKFNVLNDDQDCIDLIDYAFDMIMDLESVGHVVYEVDHMEFPCFNDEVAERFAKCLSKFFSDLW